MFRGYRWPPKVAVPVAVLGSGVLGRALSLIGFSVAAKRQAFRDCCPEVADPRCNSAGLPIRPA